MAKKKRKKKSITIFVGSSSAAKSQAKAVIGALKRPNVRFLPWWKVFTAGKTLLQELDQVRARVDAALLIFSPESTSHIRKKKHELPNLNVLFEFGYFYGRFRKKRVAMLRYGTFYLPSDLDGYIHVFGSTFFKRGAVIGVGKRTREEFTRWVRALAT